MMLSTGQKGLVFRFVSLCFEWSDSRKQNHTKQRVKSMARLNPLSSSAWSIINNSLKVILQFIYTFKVLSYNFDGENDLSYIK